MVSGARAVRALLDFLHPLFPEKEGRLACAQQLTALIQNVVAEEHARAEVRAAESVCEDLERVLDGKDSFIAVTGEPGQRYQRIRERVAALARFQKEVRRYYADEGDLDDVLAASHEVDAHGEKK